MVIDPATGWPLARLNDLGEVNRGRSRHRPRYADFLYGGPYPFIQTGDIKASGGRITKHSQTYSEAGLAQSRLWPAGTLCITIAANIAETGILDYPACFPDSVVGFIADATKADVRFVEYSFRHMRLRLQREASGTVQDNINLETLDRLRFPLPPLPEQRRIARILGALDDKIELNRRTNETLEAMARALFRAWFVDFEPVRAKQDGRPLDPLSQKHLHLFPDRLVDTEHGDIPEGWEWGKLGEVADVMMGLSPSGDSYNTEGRGEPLINGPVEFGEFFPTRSKWTETPTRFAEQGDLIFCVRGSTTGRRVVSDGRYCIGRGVCAIRARERRQGFVNLTVEIGLETLLAKTTGSVFPNLSAPDIKGFSVLLPPTTVIDAFEGLCRPLLEKVAMHHHEANVLAVTRDTLLPRLLAGEVTCSPKTAPRAGRVLPS